MLISSTIPFNLDSIAPLVGRTWTCANPESDPPMGFTTSGLPKSCFRSPALSLSPSRFICQFVKLRFLKDVILIPLCGSGHMFQRDKCPNLHMSQVNLFSVVRHDSKVHMFQINLFSVMRHGTLTGSYTLLLSLKTDSTLVGIRSGIRSSSD